MDVQLSLIMFGISEIASDIFGNSVIGDSKIRRFGASEIVDPKKAT